MRYIILLIIITIGVECYSQISFYVDEDLSYPDISIRIGDDVSYPDVRVRIGENILR